MPTKKSNKVDDKQIVKFDIETAVIVALGEKYKDIKITDGKSYAFVMKGIGEYRELRLKIDEKHKDLKKDVLEYGRAVDAEKNRLKDLLAPGENHLKEVRQVEDDRKNKIKAEKEAKEQKRVDEIRSRINDLQAMATQAPLLSLKDLHVISKRLEGIEISVVEYMEFAEEAKNVLNRVCETVQQFIATAIQREEEDAERKAESERLEKIRLEQEETQRKLDEKSAKLERDKWEKEEEARILRRLEEEKAAKESERLEREAAKIKEAAQKEALRPDKEKLLRFADELLNTPVPKVKAKEAKELLIEINNRLDKLVTGIKVRANNL